MTDTTSKTTKLQTRINAAIAAAKPAVLATYSTSDTGTQAELRLTAAWKIRVAVDEINLQRTNSQELQQQFSALQREITTAAHLHGDLRSLTKKANARSQAGASQRNADTEEFFLAAGRDFLTDLKKYTGKRAIAQARKKITDLQARQQEVIAATRRYNSQIQAERRQAKEGQRAADTAALAAGEFWHASAEALKDYFHPPFSRNHLADVSARWRAALYTEMDSTVWKAGKGDWRHKNVGTGRAYLCGIDDNGDEWGHRVDLRQYMDQDRHGDLGYEATVEEAMAELFDVSVSALDNCSRQGDLLFRPCTILKQPKTSTRCDNCGMEEWEHSEYGYGCRNFAPRTIQPPTLEPEIEWEVRESHRITSPSLRHNGRYFAAADEIRVEHTSHQPVLLPPGEYCLHELQIAGGD